MLFSYLVVKYKAIIFLYYVIKIRLVVWRGIIGCLNLLFFFFSKVISVIKNLEVFFLWIFKKLCLNINMVKY